MADFNQTKPGEGLTSSSDKYRAQMLTKNTYSKGKEGYSANHSNALGDGDDKGKGNGKYLDVFSNDIGSKTDIMGNGEGNTGRNNNLKVNEYGKDNMYGANNTHDTAPDEPGSKLDIMGNGEANTGRNNNMKVNLYGKSNEYSSGNIDSGEGYVPQQ
jgi:hypothetical protein